MANRGGRKVYRTSTNYRKKKTQKAFKVILLIIFLAALVFVGYSIGQPIYEYIADRNGTGTAEEDTRPWTPPVQTEENNAVSETTQEETSVTEKEEEKIPAAASFSALQLPADALSSAEKLNAALSNAKGSGYTAVMVTLKAEGGKIYYNTASQMALSAENAISGTMYAGQIASMIKQAGFIPVAEVNLLEDNNRYGESKSGSYRFASDDSTWLDNSVAKGGKPWLSPFDTDTQSFAEFLSNEISGAGFEYIVFDGVVFPAFRNSDLNYIGDIVKSADRYKALLDIADIAAKAAEANGSAAALRISAGDILKGTAEVFKPSELTVKIICVEYFPNDIEKTALINGKETDLSALTAKDKAQTVLGEVKRLAGGDVKIIPVIRQNDFSQEDFNEVISALIDGGCDSYVIV